MKLLSASYGQHFQETAMSQIQEPGFRKKGERRTGECVYCGKIMETTRDHVIPRCLFPPPLPENMITVQTCDPCNRAKSLDDGMLRDMLSTDIAARNSPVAAHLIDNKVISSVKQDKSFIKPE